jgi:23S rRNA-/tRNA-specific pseudouridylate synthase
MNIKSQMFLKNKPYFIYETDDFFILYKPPYWSCSTEVLNREEKLNKNKNSIVFYLKKLCGTVIDDNMKRVFNFRYGLLNRLDIETSGAVIVAKNRTGINNLIQTVHKDKEITKIYICLTNNTIQNKEGLIDLPIRCDSLYLEDEKKDYIMTICKTTTNKLNKVKKDAKSYFYKITELEDKNGNVYSLFFVRIFTGRTHQIRVHMNSMGCPLISDPTYLAKPILKENQKFCDRMFLHNIYLGFDYNGVNNKFTIPLPSDLQYVLDNLSSTKNYNIYDIPLELKDMENI